MDSTLTPKPTDPLVRYFEQIALDEQDGTYPGGRCRAPSSCCQQYPSPRRPAVVWQVSGTWLHWLAVGSVHRCRRRRLAVLRRCGQTDYREMGAAVRPVFIPPAEKPGAPPATEPTCRSGVRGDGSTSTTGTSGADRSGRRRADRSCPISGIGAVAPVDGARSRKRGARDRTAQGQHRAAQDQSGTNDPRQCEGHRAVQGEPRTNGPRYCQRFRAEPAALDISASAAADCHPDAQAGADTPVAPSQNSAARHTAAAGRTTVAIRAAV